MVPGESEADKPQSCSTSTPTILPSQVNDAIDIPDVIDMAPFITPDEGSEGEGGDDGTNVGEGAGVIGDQKYELLSICMHIGSALSGHYFAYIKEAGTGRWLNFNDANGGWSAERRDDLG